MNEIFRNPDTFVFLISAGVLLLLGVIWIIKRYRLNSEKELVDSILRSVSIPIFSQSLPELKREISRARRYQNDLSVIIFRQCDQKTGLLHEASNHLLLNGRSKSPCMNRWDFLLCGPILRDSLRAIDLLTYDGAKHQFIAILPETDKIQAVQTVNRLKKILGSTLSKKMSIGISHFPKDGLIIEDLINQAMPYTGTRAGENTDENSDKDSLFLKQNYKSR